MNVFDYLDYKSLANDRVLSMPRGGRGQYKKIADHLNTSPTIVTQVFKGDRELTPEQAVLLGDYFSFSEIESDYLILLVNHARAGTHLYKKRLREQIEDLRKKAKEVRNRVAKDLELTEEAKAILYSNWYYLAIWSLTAIKGFDNLDSISERLGLSRKKATEALNFLLKYSLVKKDSQEKLSIGPSLVHLESESSQISRHHQNWRLQAFRKYENPKPGEIFYTAPVTLSESDVIKIREKLLKYVSETVKFISESPSEKLYCMCLDWFEV